ncbi:MAG: efflux transporter outer membrane subunit [Casimicrobiaceae bacterium]
MKTPSIVPAALSTATGPRRAAVRSRQGHALAAGFALAVASAALLGLGGCASPAGIVPTATLVTPAALELDATDGAFPAVDSDWWRAFGDPTLDRLVDRALAQGPSLKVAQARLARAEAAVAAARAAEGPDVKGQLDVTRERFSANSIYPPPLGGGVFTLGNAQVGASYAFDLFGKNRAAIEAVVGSQRAAQADVGAARLLLASQVAHAYVQLGRLFAQRDVATRSLVEREQVLALIGQRVRGGLDTNVELRLGESALPELRQQVEQIDEQIALIRHALAALTAQPPNAHDALVVTLRPVQVVVVPEALPAALLGRRADISAARWRIAAAAGDVRSAKAGFYPNINLTAFAGLASIGLDRLVRAGSAQYGVGPALTLPIFDAGRLRANLRGKTADLDAAIETYNGAVLAAVHDAADQVSALRSIARQQHEQASAQAAAESAYDLATQRYRAGLSTYLTVLNAEAGVLTQRRIAADLAARALDVQIALITALGGGYADAPGSPAPAGPRAARASAPTYPAMPSGDRS